MSLFYVQNFVKELYCILRYEGYISFEKVESLILLEYSTKPSNEVILIAFVWENLLEHFEGVVRLKLLTEFVLFESTALDQLNRFCAKLLYVLETKASVFINVHKEQKPHVCSLKPVVVWEVDAE